MKKKTDNLTDYRLITWLIKNFWSPQNYQIIKKQMRNWRENYLPYDKNLMSAYTKNMSKKKNKQSSRKKT